MGYSADAIIFYGIAFNDITPLDKSYATNAWDMQGHLWELHPTLKSDISIGWHKHDFGDNNKHIYIAIQRTITAVGWGEVFSLSEKYENIPDLDKEFWEYIDIIGIRTDIEKLELTPGWKLVLRYG